MQGNLILLNFLHQQCEGNIEHAMFNVIPTETTTEIDISV